METLAIIGMCSGILGCLLALLVPRDVGALNGAAAVAFLALAVFCIVQLATHLHKRPSVTTQARTVCAQHEGVKSIVAPGHKGAYVICRDGYVFYARVRPKVWR